MNKLTIAVLAVVQAAGAATIYQPGTRIPDGFAASSGIFRQMYYGGTFNPVAGTIYNILGRNSPQITFQRATDFATANRVRFDGVLIPNDDIIQSMFAQSEFLLGYLTYSNGLFFLSEYDFSLTIGMFSPSFPIATDSGLGLTEFYDNHVHLRITANEGTNAQNADILHFMGEDLGIGSMRVNENREGTIEVWARIGSIDVSRFGAVTSVPGSAFFAETIDLLDDDFVPGASGDGSYSPPVLVSPTSAVPEPASMGICGAGLIVLLVRRRLALQKRA